MPLMSLNDWSCVIHVHSTYSDGTATVPELLADAARNDRDAILLTDHDGLSARAEGWEGWHGGVMLVVGTEITTAGGHLLAFGVERSPDLRAHPPAAAIAHVAAEGGICFAAHPFSAGSAMSKTIGRPHPWEALEDPGLTGIELWSLITDSAERWRSPLEALRFLRDPAAALQAPEGERTRCWDALGAERRVVAIGGLDAHQSGLRLRGGRALSPMPNSRFFSYLSTHVLTREAPSGDASADSAALLAALAGGCCYLAMESEWPATGFGFEASDGDRVVQMGAEVEAGLWTMRTRIPRPARLRLIRDGAVIAETADAIGLEREVHLPGIYRVEAWMSSGARELPWVISNPIYLRNRDGEGDQGAEYEDGVHDVHP
jgi:hypothetical protein